MERTLIADFGLIDNPDAGIRQLYHDPVNSHRYAREPLIGKMPNGSLICFFLTGGPNEPHNANLVMVKRSFDDGRTWTDAEVVFSHPYLGAWATELYLDGSRPMLVVSLYDASCPFKMLQTFFSYSDDCGKTWSRPTMADGAVSTCSVRKIIRLSNGDLLYPVYNTIASDRFLWNREDWYGPDWWNGTHHECAAVVSPDNGKTFFRSATISCGEDNLWEPNCVELEPGHVVMLIRHSDSGFLGRCDSFDYGRTWGDYRLTDIPNAGSKITAFKVGNKIGVAANFCSDQRTHLQLRISGDNLASWETILPLDEDASLFTYPHVFVDMQQKVLYLAYENYQKHYLLKLTFDEVGLL